MDENNCKDIDFRAKATIILCLLDEVLYIVMNKEMAVVL